MPLVGAANTFASYVCTRLPSDIAQGTLFEFLGCPVKAVAPGDEKVCSCTCSDCIARANAQHWCDCNYDKRFNWDTFKRVLAELKAAAAAAAAAVPVVRSRRYSLVELYRHELTRATDCAVSSLAHRRMLGRLVVWDDDGELVPSSREVRDFYIPAPEDALFRFRMLHGGGLFWRSHPYAKLLSKLQPLYDGACATVETAVEKYNVEAEAEAKAATAAAVAKRSSKRVKMSIAC